MGKDFPRWSWHWGQQADNNMAHIHKYPEIIDPWGTSKCLHEDATTTLPHHIYHLPNTDCQMSILPFLLYFSLTVEQDSICEFMLPRETFALLLKWNVNIVFGLCFAPTSQQEILSTHQPVWQTGQCDALLRFRKCVHRLESDSHRCDCGPFQHCIEFQP